MRKARPAFCLLIFLVFAPALNGATPRDDWRSLPLPPGAYIATASIFDVGGVGYLFLGGTSESGSGCWFALESSLPAADWKDCSGGIPHGRQSHCRRFGQRANGDVVCFAQDAGGCGEHAGAMCLLGFARLNLSGCPSACWIPEKSGGLDRRHSLSFKEPTNDSAGNMYVGAITGSSYWYNAKSGKWGPTHDDPDELIGHPNAGGYYWALEFMNDGIESLAFGGENNRIGFPLTTPAFKKGTAQFKDASNNIFAAATDGTKFLICSSHLGKPIQSTSLPLRGGESIWTGIEVPPFSACRGLAYHVPSKLWLGSFVGNAPGCVSYSADGTTWKDMSSSLDCASVGTRLMQMSVKQSTGAILLNAPGKGVYYNAGFLSP